MCTMQNGWFSFIHLLRVTGHSIGVRFVDITLFKDEFVGNGRLYGVLSEIAFSVVRSFPFVSVNLKHCRFFCGNFMLKTLLLELPMTQFCSQVDDRGSKNER